MSVDQDQKLLEARGSLTLALNHVIKVIRLGQLRIDKCPNHGLVVMGQDKSVERFVVPDNLRDWVDIELSYDTLSVSK